MKLVRFSTFCTGKVRHWAVMHGNVILFKSDHKTSCLRVMFLIRTLLVIIEALVKEERSTDPIHESPAEPDLAALIRDYFDLRMDD